MTMNPGFNSAAASQWRPLPRRASGYAVRKETVVRILLATMFYLSLWRATGMWYGYPARFDEGASVDPLPMKLMLYSLIPLIGCYVLLEPNRVLSYFKAVPVLVWIVTFFCFASLVFSVSSGPSVRGLAAVLLLTVAPLLYRFRYGNVDTFKVLTNFVIIAAFANILYLAAFPQFAIMGGSLAGAVKGLFYHKNTMGQFSAVSFIILISLGWPKLSMSYRDLVRYTAILLTLVLVVISLSSTAVVMVAVGLAILMGLRTMEVLGKNSVARSIIVFFIFLIIGLGSSFIYLGVAELIADAFGKDLTFSGRTDVWEQLLPLIYDRPIFGYGFALFRQPEIMEQYVNLSWEARSTHNTYLELALNIGLPGTIAWVVFLFQRLGKKMTAVPATRKLGELQAKEVIIIVLIMIGSMTEAGMMLAPVVLWPFMVIALPVVRLSRHQK